MTSPTPARRALAIQLAILPGLVALLLFSKPTAVAGISLYQRVVSPAFAPCGHARLLHTETCSAYAKRVIAEQGAWKGAASSVRRFAACGRLARIRAQGG